ncbi:Alpha/Beta hydrolase protein [Chaetomium fimeti]|uniref:Alpha/Beta hydrolase protein n=1 Tax=Chaetomium fimeti TaxID=1854472 RepID=A0AAE0LTQ5_9PEZI|nr:Alpha/Beta hydrolase protein [Chaetomium fimeti]
MGSNSMFEDQPSLIQVFDPEDATTTTTGSSSPWNQEHPNPTRTPKAPTPLILMHDGGGTIFSYYCLGDLRRTVHGIANPHYETGRAWAGGIPEMARDYLGFVASVVPTGGDVILGGWSLGGLLALEMARQAAADGSVRVVGLVMVDSVCPLAPVGGGRNPPLVVPHAMQWHEHTRPETREKVMRCFAEAVRMVGEWTLPVWEGKAGDGPKPPPVVMLRARESVPVAEGVSRVDLHRSDRLLGWGGYRKDLIKEIIDIPGHHYNVFDTEDNVDAATEAIAKACLLVEKLDAGRAFS